jgi:L-fuconate dehydratase
MVQHLQIFDYISITGSKDGRFIEHVAEEHEHFEDPCELNDKACYKAPMVENKLLNLTIN